MKTAPASVKDQLGIAGIGLPVLHYIDVDQVLYRIPVSVGAPSWDEYVAVVGGDGGSEWLFVQNGRVCAHSDCGYGDAAHALMDGLRHALQDRNPSPEPIVLRSADDGP